MTCCIAITFPTMRFGYEKYSDKKIIELIYEYNQIEQRKITKRQKLQIKNFFLLMIVARQDI